MSNPVATAKLLDALTELYELGRVTSVLALGEPGSARCLKVITEAGAFVARRYRTGTFNQVELSTGFLSWCQKRQFQLVPELVPSKNGDFCFQLQASESRRDASAGAGESRGHTGAAGSSDVGAGGQDWWWVARFVDGHSLNDWKRAGGTAATCFKAGRALRLFHEQTRAYGQVISPQDCQIKPVAQDLRNRFDATLGGIEYKRLRQTLFQCLVVANEDPTVPMLVHGDFHPGNLVTADNEIAAILDLEYMHFEKPVFDVAYGGMMFSSSGRRSKLDFALLREFLRGYDEPAFLPYLIPNMVSAACLCAVWMAQQNDRGDDFKHFINGAQYLSGLLQEDCVKILGRQFAS